MNLNVRKVNFSSVTYFDLLSQRIKKLLYLNEVWWYKNLSTFKQYILNNEKALRQLLRLI